MPQTIRYYPTHLLLGLTLIICQSTFLAKLGGFNLILVLIIHLAADGHFLTGGLLAFGLGLAQDVFSAAPPGLSSLLYLGLYYGSCLIRRSLHLGHPLHQMVAVLAAGTIYVLVMARVSGLLVPRPGVWLRLVLTALAAPLLFALFTWLEGLQARLAGARTVE